jgi:hypothetical protein
MPDEAAHFLEQPARRDGLAQIRIAPRRERGVAVAGAGESCDHDHRDVARLDLITHRAHGVPSTRPRHRDVHEDEHRQVIARALDRLAAIAGFDDDVAGVGQDVDVQGTLVGIVVRDEDRATGRRCHATKLTGTRSRASPSRARNRKPV